MSTYAYTLTATYPGLPPERIHYDGSAGQTEAVWWAIYYVLDEAKARPLSAWAIGEIALTDPDGVLLHTMPARTPEEVAS